MTLAWAGIAHASALARVHHSAFAEAAWTEEALTGLIAHPHCLSLMAAGGSPLSIGAFVMMQLVMDEAEVLTIAVQPTWQRQGVGGRLLDAMMLSLRERGARTVLLEVGVANTPALALYARRGFEQVGRRKAYYAQPDGTGTDALILRALLA